MKNAVHASILGTVFALSCLASGLASASDGTITFAGKIDSVTCTISGNGGGSSFTVTLPTVATTALNAAGVTAGRTPFNLSLSGCGATPLAVSTYFESGPTVDVATGKLINSTGTATNVELGLLNSDATAITLGAAQASQNSKSITTTAAGTGTLSYFVEYVANGAAATAGTVGSTVTYSIVYP